MSADVMLQTRPEQADLRPDIRRLLATGMEWEGIGDAAFVLADLETALEDYPTLFADIAEQTGQFAREAASTMLSATLRVTEERPDDIGEHNPNKIVLYEEDGLVQNDFMNRTQRFTISGTKSSVASLSDLDAYMNASKKTRAVLYLGSFRVDDMTAADLDYDALIDTLAALGMDEGAIENLVKLLLSGDAPEALVEAVRQIMALPASDHTPEQIMQALTKLDVALSESVSSAPPRLAAILSVIQSGLQPVLRQPPAVLAQRMATPPQPSERLTALKMIASVVQTTAALIRDPALPAQDKAKLQETLATLRVNLFKEGPAFTQAFQNLATRIAPLAQSVEQKQIVKGPASLVQETSLFTKIMQVSVSLARVAVMLTAPSARPSMPLPSSWRRMDAQPSMIRNAPYAFSDAKQVVSRMASPYTPAANESASPVPQATASLTPPVVMLDSVAPAAPVPAPQTIEVVKQEANENVAPPAQSAPVMPAPAQTTSTIISQPVIVTHLAADTGIRPAEPVPVTNDIIDIIIAAGPPVSPPPEDRGDGGGDINPDAKPPEPDPVADEKPEDILIPDDIKPAEDAPVDDMDTPVADTAPEAESEDDVIEETEPDDVVEEADGPEEDVDPVEPDTGPHCPTGPGPCECFDEVAAPPSHDEEVIFRQTEEIIADLESTGQTYQKQDTQSLWAMMHGTPFDTDGSATADFSHVCGPGCDHDGVARDLQGEQVGVSNTDFTNMSLDDLFAPPPKP